MEIETGMRLVLRQFLSCPTVCMEGGWLDLGFREDGAAARRETGSGTHILEEIKIGDIV